MIDKSVVEMATQRLAQVCATARAKSGLTSDQIAVLYGFSVETQRKIECDPCRVSLRTLFRYLERVDQERVMELQLLLMEFSRHFLKRSDLP